MNHVFFQDGLFSLDILKDLLFLKRITFKRYQYQAQRNHYQTKSFQVFQKYTQYVREHRKVCRPNKWTGHMCKYCVLQRCNISQAILGNSCQMLAQDPA